MNPPSVLREVLGKGQRHMHVTAESVGFGGRRLMWRLWHSVLPDPDAPLALPQGSTDRSHRRRLDFSVSTLVLAGILLLLLIPLTLLFFRQHYDDRIYPAVVLADVPVGGLTLAEAETRIAQRVSSLEDQVFVFSHGDQTWTPTLSELGATINISESVAGAQQLGRTGDAVSRLTFTGSLLTANQHLDLLVDFDQDALTAWFDAVDRDIGQPAVDAQLIIDGAQVSVSPDVIGTVVDRQAATRLVSEALIDLQPGHHALPTHEAFPAVTVNDLLPTQALAEQILGTPVVVAWEGQQWNLDPAVISQHLEVVASTEEPAAFRVDVNVDHLAATLRAEYGQQVNRLPLDAVIRWEGKAVVVESGQHGATLDAPAFAQLVADSFLGQHTRVEIPVVQVAPRIIGDELETLGIDTLLGEGQSNYSGGVEDRDENVRVATEYLNATLVPPGGIFSFNDAIGEITAERGFEEGLVVQNGPGRDVGGGVCQVSTTIFRAALHAGMPITEWYPHSYRLATYELDGWGPGFDASILQFGPDPAAWPDFEFENYTDGWLLIEASTTYPHVSVNIYGRGDGRTVTLESHALGGNAFGFVRTIYDATGNVIAERQFDSYYL